MKTTYFLLFILLGYSSVGTAQDEVCLPAEQRQLIKDMIATNRVKYGIEQGSNEKFLPNAYIWPVVPSPTTNVASVTSICQFVDHDPSGGLLDWNCGDQTYNGHRGTDICCTPYPWYMVENEEAHIVAMASGTILWKMDGNDSYSCDFSQPNWNGIGIQHSDGSTAWYGHLKENSLTTKSVGQSVTPGEYLGVMASSGMSTGPHLHIEIYDTNDNLVDPYAGSCNGLNPTTSYWQNQPDYYHAGINRVTVQSAPVEYGPNCNSIENPNYLEVADAGDVLNYRLIFSGITAGTSVDYRIVAPDGTNTFSQSSNLTSDNFSWIIGATYTLPNDVVTGNYRFEATYLGVTVDYEFEVMGGSSSCSGTTVVVTNTSDSGPGSLRAALECANSSIDTDTVLFNLPGNAPHVISLLTHLPTLSDDDIVLSTVLSGYTLGDVVLDVENMVPSHVIITQGGDNLVIEGLRIMNAPSVVGTGGINVKATNGTVVRNNWITQGYSGIVVGNFSNNVTVEDNVIGTDLSGAFDLGLGRAGIATIFGVNNSIVRRNTIAHCNWTAIACNQSSNGNLFTENIMYCNGKGIDLDYGESTGNLNIQPPVIFTATENLVQGSTSPNTTVELYASGRADCPTAACQGTVYLGSTIADQTGEWGMNGDLSIGDLITALTYDAAGNTSEFSGCFLVTEVPENDLCSSATTLNLLPSGGADQSFGPYSTSGSTGDGALTACAQSSIGGGIWFSFAGAGNNVELFVAGGGTSDPLMNFSVTVFQGFCGALTEVACSGSSGGVGDPVSITTSSTSTYFVYVEATSPGEEGDIEIQFSQSACHPDLNGLMALYNSTNGPGWTTRTGWEEGVDGTSCNPCDFNGGTWFGIRCNSSGRVTEIDLDSNNSTTHASSIGGNGLSGILPQTLVELEFLVELDLDRNNISGNFPEWLSRMNLSELYLGNNNLSGGLPQNLGESPNLSALHLENNAFTGTLPARVLQNAGLRELWVENNNLGGTLPAFDEATSLREFYGHGNNFSGSLPDGLWNISGMRELWLADNNLSGCFPTGLQRICDIGYNTFLDSQGYNFDNNPGLSFGGDYQRVCEGETAPGCSSCSDEVQNGDEEGIDCGGSNCAPCACAHPDYDGLMALYNSTNGSGWTNKSGWEEGAAGTSCDPCNFNGGTWYGVTCTNNRVTCLDLDGSVQCGVPNAPNGIGMTGTLPAEIGDLSDLEGFFIGGNQVGGIIPPEIGSLQNLRNLNLFNNDFTGSIPAEIGQLTNLESLRLNFNELTGSIPAVLGTLTSLIEINLGSNQLSGSIPSEFGNLGNIQGVYLSNNNLTGDIPAELGNMTSLLQLHISFNQLSGVIPVNLGNISNIQSIILDNNLLTGEIPESFGSFVRLDRLLLNNNSLSGSIPLGLVSQTDMRRLDLGMNQLTGEIPAGFGNLNQLTLLRLNDNFLEGCFPPDLEDKCGLGVSTGPGNNGFNYTNNPELPYLGDYNSICNGNLQVGAPCNDNNPTTTGETIQPDCSCGLPAVTCTDGIQNGNETGIDCGGPDCVPCACAHPDYDGLMALYNDTDGENWNNGDFISWIEGAEGTNCDPCSWSGITCNTNGRVTEIRLAVKNLTGTLPSELGQLTELEVLFLPRNRISGQIPTSVYNLANLKSIYLFNNEIDGAISPLISNLTLLEEFDFSANSLEGAIPQELFDCNRLRRFWVPSNQLMGEFPTGIENLTQLEEFSVGGNSLAGIFPDQLWGITSLVSIDISSNNWDPYQLPPEVGLLTQLRQLEMDRSNAFGPLPAEIAALPNIISFRAGVNNLSGCFPASFSSRCTDGSWAFSNNPLLPYAGVFSDWCDGGNVSTGAPCNDSNPATTNDAIDANCNCTGQLPATCNDGIQNGTETGIDCGGPDCQPCVIPCVDIPLPDYRVSLSENAICEGESIEVSFTLNIDGNPPYRALVQGFGLPVNAIENMPGDGTPVVFTVTPTTTQFTYQISNVEDAEGCRWSPAWIEDVFVGTPVATPLVSCLNSTTTSVTITYQEQPNAVGYQVQINGGPLQASSGGTFTASNLPADSDVTVTVIALAAPGCPNQSTTITCRTLAPACDDGLQNGDEEGVDCGGSNCVSCFVPCNETGYTYSIEASDAVVCSGTEITLSLFLNAENGNPPYQMAVSDPDGVPTVYDHPGDGSAVTFNATPSVTGVYRIEELIDGASCSYTNAANVAVTVEDPIADPVLTCVTTTQSSITIGWDVNAAADRYELYVDGAGPQIVEGGTFTVNNLPPDGAVNFELFLVSSSVCFDPFSLLSCRTLADPCAEDAPLVNVPSATGLCAFEGIVDLSVLEADILLGQEATVEWFTDAAGGQVIADQQNFAPATAPFTVYVRATNTDCSSAITPITLDRIDPQVPPFGVLPTMLCYDDPIYQLPQPTDGTTGAWTLSSGGIVTAINPALYGNTTLLLFFDPDFAVDDCLTYLRYEVVITEPSELNFSLSADTVCTDSGLVVTILGADAGAMEVVWSAVPQPVNIVAEGNTATFYFAEVGNATVTGQRIVDGCAGEPVSESFFIESCEECARIIDCIPQNGQSASLVMIDTFVDVGATVCVPVLVADLTNFVDLGFSLQWDSAVFSFVEVRNLLPELGVVPVVSSPYQTDEVAINIASAESGTVSFYWRSYAPEDDCTLAPPLTLPDATALFEVCLQVTQVPLQPETNLSFVNQPQVVTGNKQTQCQSANDALIASFGARAVLNGACEHPDYAPLMALYEETAGAQWIDTTGWAAGARGASCDPCSYEGAPWYGVFCENGRVTVLDLDGNASGNSTSTPSGNGLSGELPEQIGNLTELQGLYFSQNNLSGPLPFNIGQLTNLQSLSATKSGLSGDLPLSLYGLTNLSFLDLGVNNFTGQIDNALGDLTELRIVRLDSNAFTGIIPERIGELIELTSLELDNNNLTGAIPVSVGQLVNLEQLYLYSNRLTGELPTSLGNLASLQILSIGDNGFTGSIPEEIGNLTNLTGLILRDNELSGEIPESLGNLINLFRFHLYGNQLTGSIPASIGNLTNVRFMFFRDNNLTGCIPPELAALCNDEAAIDFSPNPGMDNDNWTTFCSNGLGTCLPAIECDHPDYPALMSLYSATNGPFWTNQSGWAQAAAGEACDPCNFNGAPWYGITCDQGRVVCVDLDGDPNCSPNDNAGNGLVGTIPQEFFNLDAAQCISIAGQGVTGELPPDYTGVPAVRCFSFINTDLQGEVPLGVSAMTNVRRFILEDGDFSGPFPEGLRNMNDIQDITITFSDISGPLPAWLGELGRLRQLFLVGNNLQGQIPAELGQLDSLVTLFAQNNDLEGPIPEEIAQILTLREIALSRNRLNGAIPLALFDLPDLEFLYLYSNELTGDVGEIISRVNGLQALYLDDNNLTGCYELNEELCDLPEVSTFGGSSIFDGVASAFYNENGYNFRNNDGLPLEGSYAAFCDGEEQAGSSCDDGNPLTENDVITIDCGCEGQLINTLPITLTISEAEATAGEEIVINFTADTLDGVVGFQFGFTYEPELLEFLSISDNLAGPDVNFNSSIAGQVRVAWTSFGPGVLGSDVDLFSAAFLVLDTCSNQIAIDTLLMPLEFNLESGTFPDVDYSDTGMVNGNRNCCSDGIQNGSETGVDCGGTNCTPCECEDTDLVIFNGNITPASCSAANGSATAIATGGVPPYTYEWSNGATTAVNDNLLPGDYFVTVTDALGCSVTNSGNPARILDNAPIMPVCPDDLFFTVDANADSLLFDVVPPAIGDCTDEGLSYQVTGATDLSGQGIPEALILNLGTSMLTFTTGLDSCSYSVTVVQSTVDCSDLLIISLEARTAVCYGDSSGLINVDLAGGSGNYEIQWSTGQTVEDLQDLEPGVYVLDLLDVDTECTVTAGFWLQSPDSIQIECVVVAGETVTNALVSFSGAVLPVTLDLAGTTGDRVVDLSETNYEFTDLAPGAYEVVLTDANGCQAFCSFEVFAEPDNCEDPANQPTISLDALNSYVICPGQSTELVLLLDSNQIVEWRAEPDGIVVGTDPSLAVSTITTYSFSILDTITGCAIDSFVTLMPDQRMPVVVCPEDTTVLLNMGQFTSVTVSSGIPEVVFAPCNDISFPPAEDLELAATDTYTWQYQSANGQGGSCERTINVIATDTMTIYVDEPNIYRRGTDTLMIPIAIRNWSNVASFIFDLEATVQTAGGTLVPIALAPNPAFVDGIDIELLSPTRISVTWTSAPGEMDVPSDFRLLELPLVVTGNPGDCVNLHFGTSFDNAATAMMEGQQIYLSTVDGLACLPLVASMSGNVFRLRPDLTVAPLANVTLELQQQEEGSLSSLSLEDGRYRFEELPVNESYEIVPSLADDFRRGIDLLDVVLLRDIWLNYDNPVSISTPYQLIAADVFPDCQINFIDLTFEVQMMLGGIDSFPGNTPWRFIPSAFEFPEEYALCDPVFPESITYSPLLEDQPAGDFIGVKTGDLSLNASSPLLEGTTEIEMEDQLFQAGDTVRVSRILGAGEVAAAIYYRYDLSALSYLPSYNQMNGKPFRLNYSNKAGEIDQVLIDAAGEDELVFIAMQDGRLSRALFLREGSQVASLDHRFNALKLRWKDVALVAKGIEFSVYPNPFSDQLFIRFESVLSDDADLTIRDLTGRTLYQDRLTAGTDRYVLETGANNLPPGVYLVTVENGLVAQRKMVIRE